MGTLSPFPKISESFLEIKMLLSVVETEKHLKTMAKTVQDIDNIMRKHERGFEYSKQLYFLYIFTFITFKIIKIGTFSFASPQQRSERAATERAWAGLKIDYDGEGGWIKGGEYPTLSVQNYHKLLKLQLKDIFITRDIQQFIHSTNTEDPVSTWVHFFTEMSAPVS